MSDTDAAMTEKCCETCRFFDPYWEDGDQPPYTGDCTRYPPVWIGDGQEFESPAETWLWSMPHVGAFHCCGEWTKREERE